MSIVTTCDHCEQTIKDVAYLLVAVDAQAPILYQPVSEPTHLHWECVAPYGREETTGDET